MKATELQINDWLNYNNTASKVYCIESPFERKNEKFNNKHIVTLWCNGFIDAVEEEITPIPLTEDILRANGFDVTRKNYNDIETLEFWKQGNKPDRYRMFIGKRSDEDDFYMDIDCSFPPYTSLRTHVTSIHQFQHILRDCGLDDLADNFKV